MASRVAVTRFAPSPTGYLHLGHAFAALTAWSAARGSGGRFLLRIEDIDRSRCRSVFEAAIRDDLAWLGIAWDGTVWHQSERQDAYAAALTVLADRGFTYPCFCTRRDIAQSLSAPHGPDGPIYPGICRMLGAAERDRRIARGDVHALRLDVARALAVAGDLAWTDREVGSVVARPAAAGDIVMARKDIGTSYHLAVVVDDADQGITLVTRGDDLFAATHVQRLLQALLGLPTPAYHHHRLIMDEGGGRLAKRTPGVTLRDLRAAGATPAEIRSRLGFV
ncbi:MAG: tRNA glutamyl-Q(34) synthetase GluQRS [Alphaproteobacteria bacterium]|nr:tRNA glutamyl-Q(34) synthetase GluQRS [Alphaproteobacteria bacterium]